ncbi:MAG: sulfite exporter TauE/SafE family protein [Thermoanaerobaculia bacterium]|nr:sulfite exporter TauE/SafE family protein [Thermoanaerobaculia bacterium]
MTLSAGLIVGLLLAGLIGLSLGLIGGGGSIITVPLLVYVIGVEPHAAIPMSLAIVGSTSLVGSLMHHRTGGVVWRTALLFGSAGIAGAFLGARLTYLVSDRALMLIFAALMLFVSSLMLLRGERRDREIDHHAVLWKAISAGLGVGILTGFLGVGGGFLIVPALMLFGHLPVREAIGTSLVVIAINCASGLAGHLRFGGFDLLLTALVSLFAIGGAFAGTAMANRTSPANLRKGFAFFVMAVGIFLVARNA